MSWPVALLLAYAALGLELGLSPELRLGRSAIAPSFVVPLVVFFSLFAPPVTAMWTGLAMGLAIDLCSPRGEGAVAVAGPYALGLLAASYFTLTVRGLVIRRNPLTLVLLAVVGAAMMHLVVVGLLTFRSAAYADPGAWSGGRELVQRLMASLYTGVSAAVMALVLFPMFEFFRFHDANARRASVKRY